MGSVPARENAISYHSLGESGWIQITERIRPPSCGAGVVVKEKTLSENCFTVSVLSE